MVNMKGKDIVTLHHLSSEEILQILKTAEILKIKQFMGESHQLLQGKTLGMIFQKPSLRTRVSFETGMTQLGGHAIYLGNDDISLGARESIEDIALVLSRYVDVIMARTFEHQSIIDLAKYASVPVINALSNFCHPCQALADLLTIQEKKRQLRGLKLVFIGEGYNMATSLVYGAAKVGLHITVVSPVGYELNANVLREARQDAEQTGARIELSNDPVEALEGADIVYTDVWTNMGQESEQDERKKVFKNYYVDIERLNKAKSDAIFLHCLPAHYGEEMTYEVAKDPRSVIYDQAENRLHVQKAVLALIV